MIDGENLAPGDKKGQFAEIAVRPEIAPDPLQFPTSVDLVVKNFDKLSGAMLPVQWSWSFQEGRAARSTAPFKSGGMAGE